MEVLIATCGSCLLHMQGGLFCDFTTQCQDGDKVVGQQITQTSRFEGIVSQPIRASDGFIAVETGEGRTCLQLISH